MKKEEFVFQLMCKDVSVKKNKNNKPDMRYKENKKLYINLMSDDDNIYNYHCKQEKLTPLEIIAHLKDIFDNPDIIDNDMKYVKSMYSE